MESKSVALSFIWKFLERGAAQAWALIVQIILARLLAPNDFGTLAILMVFVNIANVLIQKGFATALVQNKDIDDLDINTVLLVSELIAVLIYIVLWFIAPFIENIYKTTDLAIYLRTIAISLFTGAFYSIENSLLIRNMQFKRMFLSSFSATMIAGILAIILAYAGMECWALIWHSNIQQLLLAVFSFRFCRWKIELQYSKKSFDKVFRFGSNVLLSELLYTSVENLRTLLIGTKYSQSDLAYYDRGQTYPSVAMRSIYDAIGSVLLPVFSKNQNDLTHLRITTQKALGFSFFLIAPCFIGFAAIAEQFTVLLLTNKWSPCVIYMKIFCVYQLAIPSYCIFRNALYALGESKRSLWLEIIKASLTLCAVIFGLLMSPLWIAIFSTISVWFSTFIYGIATHRHLKFNLKEMVLDILPVILACIIMSIVISLINMIIANAIIKIIIDILAGIITYIASLALLRSRYYMESINIIKRLIQKYAGDKL